MKERILDLKQQLKQHNIQGMIISNPVNIKYLTSIDAEGTLLVNSSENIFLTDARYIEGVNNLLTIDDEIVVYDVKALSETDYESFFPEPDNVGFEENYVVYSEYKKMLQKYKVNLVETEGIIEKQRIIKDNQEIENISKACKITDDCFEYILKYIQIGMTEKEIAEEMRDFMIKAGADDLSFDTIVASGKNSSIPHAVPTDKKIEENETLLIDFGCKVNGYCSDCTRTIYIGRAPEEFKENYKFVLSEQETLLKSLRDGVNLKTEISYRVYNYQKNNYELFHSFGHGVGLDIHEAPTISHKNDFILKKNMVITDEPGVYFPGKYGIRIEDTVLVGGIKCERLTKSEKELIELKL